VVEAERWRTELIKDLTRRIEKIHEPGLTDGQLRDVNDDINNKLRIKEQWVFTI
jgi:pre-mRNA-splicing factor ISY1